MRSFRHITFHNLLIISLFATIFTSCEKDRKTSTLPVIYGAELFSTGSDAVTVKATLKYNEGMNIKNAGALLGLLPEPADENSFVMGSISDSILFVRIENLTPGTKYYLRFIIECPELDVYSDDIEFTTLNTVSDAEGNRYNTVSLGSKVWMKENLRSRVYSNGAAIPYISSEWSSLKTAAYTWYDFDESNGQTYGALYNWPAVESGNLCPAGWHVSTGADWNSLTAYLGGEQAAGSLLKKETGYWEQYATGTRDYSGFSALPAGSSGIRLGSFSGKGLQAFWWESSVDYTYNSEQGMLIFRAVSSDRPDLDRNGFMTKGGPLNFLSVRCVKD